MGGITHCYVEGCPCWCEDPVWGVVRGFSEGRVPCSKGVLEVTEVAFVLDVSTYERNGST